MHRYAEVRERVLNNQLALLDFRASPEIFDGPVLVAELMASPHIDNAEVAEGGLLVTLRPPARWRDPNSWLADDIVCGAMMRALNLTALSYTEY